MTSSFFFDTYLLMKELVATYFKGLQNSITQALNELNQKKFVRDLWKREGGGGGDTRIYSGGNFLEKGGVNFSEVYGDLESDFAKTLSLGNGTQFYASGVSLVLHPSNPFVPTVHANFRYIERGGTGWFGGGADLTPYYPFDDDCAYFHTTFYEALRPFGKYLYDDFKTKCDQYFYLPHRNETRGIGGIFFDHEIANEEKFQMVQSCGNSFTNAYLPIVKKRNALAYSVKNKEFQEIRRGRYVEFNLLYDRGTLFGLKTKGRVESILMSLPAKVRWEYNYTPAAGSEESRLFEYLKPRVWVNKDK